MYILLHLALELTDLLLAQLVITRRELESSQYGPFTSDFSVHNRPRGDARCNNSIDNGLQTESNRANDTTHTSRRNTSRERFPRNRSEMPSTSTATHEDNAEDLLDVNRHYHNKMAEQLKRLLRRRAGIRSENSLPTGNRTSNPVVTRSINNNNDNNPTGNAQSEGNRQSISNTGHILSENALSAEVQSIVERIQSSSSINNDDHVDESRTGVDSRGMRDIAENNLREAHTNESESVTRTRDYRRSYRNIMASSESTRHADEPNNSRESETGMRLHFTSNWQDIERYEQETVRQLLRPQRSVASHQVLRRPNSSSLRDCSHRYSSLRRDGNADSNSSVHNVCTRRRFLHREGTSSLRQEFNVPELQVNSVPVSDLNTFPHSLRRRRISSPPPLVSNTSSSPSSNTFFNNRNDRTIYLMNQPGPSSATSSSNRNRV